MHLLHMALIIGLVLIAAGMTGLYFAAKEERSVHLTLASWLLIVLGVIGIGIEYWQIAFFAPPFR
ncbi:MAG TPA: hypothetical protein VMV79_06570 [Alphaproteobacteria bacterium]|nr:hypothetical protein [Alphaproteobacteria bacterium]